MRRQLDEAIVERLRRGGPATPPGLAAAVDAHPARVRRRCDTLQEAGVLCLTTGGLYTVAGCERRDGPTDANAGRGRPAASD